jgi:hypothetical protein
MPKKQSPKPCTPGAFDDEMADFDADMERDEALDRPRRTSPFVSDDLDHDRARELELIWQWLKPRRQGGVQ